MSFFQIWIHTLRAKMPPKKGGKKGAAGYKMAPQLPNGTVLQVV